MEVITTIVGSWSVGGFAADPKLPKNGSGEARRGSVLRRVESIPRLLLLVHGNLGRLYCFGCSCCVFGIRVCHFVAAV